MGLGLGLGAIINMGGSQQSSSPPPPTSADTRTATIDAETNTRELLPYSPAKAKAKALARAAASNRPSASTMPLLLFRRLRKTARSGSAIRFRILLSASIFLFALLLLAPHRLAPLMGWNHHHLHHPTSAPNSASFSSSRGGGGGGYTVLINTWKRNDLLKQAVGHYAACSMTDAIHVVWSEGDPPPDRLEAYLRNMVLSSATTCKPSFRFELNEEDNLNNRFKPIKDPKNDAIFSVDDDVLVPCTTLNNAFTVWQMAPDTMVGFVPRMHWLDKEEDGVAYYKYGGWWSVWWVGTYSMILSKAAFFHRKYLDMYTYDMPSSIHDYVTRERNCEDLAMSLLVANATGAPPIWVRGKIREIGSSGISSLKGHNEWRNKCLNDFISLYKTMPLVSTNMKAVDARREWFW